MTNGELEYVNCLNCSNFFSYFFYLVCIQYTLLFKFRKLMTGKSRKTDCFCTRLKNCVMSCLACRVVAKHNAANLSLKIGCIVSVPKALEVIALLLVAKRKTCPVPSTDSVTRKVCFYYYEYMRCFLSLNNCPLTGFT